MEDGAFKVPLVRSHIVEKVQHRSVMPGQREGTERVVSFELIVAGSLSVGSDLWGASSGAAAATNETVEQFL